MSKVGESTESHESKMKKYQLVISLLLLLTVLLATWLFPVANPIVGMFSLLVSLALSTHTIYTKHKGIEDARAKILKEVSVMVFTLVAVIFLWA